MWYQLLLVLLVVIVLKGAPVAKSIMKNLATRLPLVHRAWGFVEALGATARRPLPLKFAAALFLPAVLVFTVHFWKGVDPGASSTAAIGYVFVPIGAVLTALPFAFLGMSLGAFIQWRQQKDSTAAYLSLVAGLISISVIGVGASYWLGEDNHKARVLEAYVRLQSMDDAALQAFMRNDPMGQDRILLGVIAMHPASSTATLAKIASLDRPDLHEKYGEYKPQMMGNRRGLAVMRLVARHPNVDVAILTLLAKSPNAYVQETVAGNRLTPPDVIERLYSHRSQSEGYLVSLSVARNPSSPAPILRELVVESCNEYVLRNLKGNEGAPEDVRQKALERITRRDYQVNCFQ